MSSRTSPPSSSIAASTPAKAESLNELVAAAAGVVGETDLQVLAAHLAAAAAGAGARRSVCSSLAQAARAMLPASSSAAAFIFRARRKTISSLGGRGRRFPAASRWVGIRAADGRPDGTPRAHDQGTLTARAGHVQRPVTDRDAIVANFGHTRPARPAGTGGYASGRAEHGTRRRGAAAAPAAVAGRRSCSRRPAPARRCRGTRARPPTRGARPRPRPIPGARRRARHRTAAPWAARSWTPAAWSSPTAHRRCPAGLAATGWLVADAGTGEVLAARDPHGRYYPASTLKTLTLLTLLPVLDPAEVVDGTAEDENVEGSRVGLVQGGRYPVQLLFQALVLQSGNDAANALARAAGGIGRRCRDERRRPRTLGAFDTVAGTPSGLDVAGQSSSPYDLALIFRALLDDPATAAVLTHAAPRRCPPCPAAPPATRSRTRTRCSTTYPGNLGGKTGFTDAARHTFVTAAERDGRRLVVSVMDTENTPAARRRPGRPAAGLGLRRARRHRRGRAAGRRPARCPAPPPPAATAADTARARSADHPRRTAADGRGPVVPAGAGGHRRLLIAGGAAGRPLVRAAASGRRVDPSVRRRTGAGVRPGTGDAASHRPEGRRPRRREEREAGHHVDPHQQAHGATEAPRRSRCRRSATGRSRRSA